MMSKGKARGVENDNILIIFFHFFNYENFGSSYWLHEDVIKRSNRCPSRTLSAYLSPFFWFKMHFEIVFCRKFMIKKKIACNIILLRMCD